MSLLSMREEALAFFKLGVESANPYLRVKNTISLSGSQLHIGNTTGNWSKIHVIAIGKAACNMLLASLEQIPEDKIVQPVIAVTNDENLKIIPGAEVLVSGHPVPDQRGLDAVQVILKKLQACAPGELLLVLLSGGGSALLPAPTADIGLADKILLNQMLLASGADITEINCIRKHCSVLKGGGLAKMAGGADIACLAISDVIDNDPSSIASGPTQADTTTYQKAIELLEKYQLWNSVPLSIKQHLSAGAAGLIAETLKDDSELSGTNFFEIIASNSQSVESVMLGVAQSEYVLSSVIHGLHGEATSVAVGLLNQFKSKIIPTNPQGMAMIAGGETTVTLGSTTGKGGRNQELALAFALNAEKIGLEGQWCFISAGTDGRDGPTDAAGGIVDNHSLDRMRAKGINPEELLTKHDSYRALKASQDLVITGATGTNVADLQILLWKPIHTSGDQYV